MKQLLVLCLSLVLLFSLVGCGKDKADKKAIEKGVTAMEKSDSNKKTDETSSTTKSDLMPVTFEKLSILIPSDYSKLDVSKVDATMIAYMINTYDRSSVNVVAEKLPSADMTLDEYIQSEKDQTGFDYKSSRRFNSGGKEWDEQVSTIPESKLQLNQRTVIHDGVAYIFTYGAFPENADKYIDQYDEIIKSVKFN